MLTVYRRKNDRDAWHWCKNCSNWPKGGSDYAEIEAPVRPSTGEFCNECKAKAARWECKE